MKRGFLVAAVLLVEALIAVAVALAFGFLIDIGTSYAQRSGNWEGSFPAYTPAERAAAHAAGRAAFASTFVVVLVAELVFTTGIFFLIRRASRRSLVDPSTQEAVVRRPLAVWIIAAAFTYSACATLPRALWNHFVGTFSPLDYVSLCIDFGFGAVGLWGVMTRQPAPRIALICIAVPLCVVSYLTCPPFGPSLVLWPIALVLLLASDSVRDHFSQAHPASKPEHR